MTPRPHYLITSTPKNDGRESEQGYQLNENTDDLTVFVTVLRSSSDLYKEGDKVVVSILDAQSFRDADKEYYFIKDEDVLSTYGG